MNEETIAPEVVKAVEEIKAEQKASQEKLLGQMQKVSEEKANELIEAYKKEAGEYQKNLDEQLKNLQEQADELDRKAQSFKTKDEGLSVKQQFCNFIKENIAEKAEQLSQKGASANMEFKAVGDMASTNVTTAITDEQFPGQMVPGVSHVAKRPTFIQSLINTASVSNTRTVTWFEQTTSEGGPAARAEAATMVQTDYDWVRVEETLKFYSTFAKVSNESLSDWNLLMAEIQFELMRDMELKIDSALLSDDGTSNTITGILNKSSLFEAGNLLDSVPTGTVNNFDVLRVAIKQIVVDNFFPTVIVLHPGDAAEMDISKASDGHYILPPFSTPRGQTIKGVPVVENTGITAGSFLVMDGSRATAYFREGLSMRVWEQNENDVLFNRKTITANVELLLRIASNDVPAFVKGTFANAKALLDASLSGSGS